MENSYKIISTDAYILHSYQRGESDKTITMLTKENGVVDVYARSIRNLNSKLRSNSTPYSKVYTSIICGKNYILKDVFITDRQVEIWDDEEKYTAYVSLLRNLKNILPRDEMEKNIFNVVDTTENFLKKSDKNEITPIILISYFFIFHSLGYVEGAELTKKSFDEMLVLYRDEKIKKRIKSSVENAFKNY